MSNALLCSIRVDKELDREQAQEVAIIRVENYIKETILKFTNDLDVVDEIYNKLLNEIAKTSTKLVKVNCEYIAHYFKAFDIATKLIDEDKEKIEIEA